MRLRLLCLGLISSALSMMHAARAAVVYDEAIDGDLSTSNESATQLGRLVIGESTIVANANSFGDFVSFEIGEGEQLDSIVLGAYSGGDNGIFAALDDLTFPDGSGWFRSSVFEINSNMPLPPSDEWLGGAVIRASDDLGTDVLDDLGDNRVDRIGRGFTGPLGAGTYTLFFQQTNGQTDIQLDFNVGAVAIPEPGSLAGCGTLAAVAFGGRRRRR